MYRDGSEISTWRTRKISGRYELATGKQLPEFITNGCSGKTSQFSQGTVVQGRLPRIGTNSTRVSASNDAFIETNLEGTIVRWRGSAESMFGYSASEALRRNVAILYPPTLRTEIPSGTTTLPGSNVERFEAKRIKKDGTPIDVSVILCPVTNSRGQLRGVLSIYRVVGRERQQMGATPSTTSSDAGCGNTESQTMGPGKAFGLHAGKPLGVVLATAGSGGTIAAVRHLRASGLVVSVITNDLLSAALWSKSRGRAYLAPSESASERFINRLLAIGAAKPGQILLPTSDQTAWLYTKNADLLKQHFCLYQPSVETMERILSKKLFEDAVRKAGLAVLPSWTPRNLDELSAIAPRLPYPILIKPSTHVHRVRNNKGLVVRTKSELIEQYQNFVNIEEFCDSNDLIEPHTRLPVLQQFVSEAKDSVCSITGFIDRSGELFVTRRATKVFQRSQPIGVGVCFESSPDDQYLSSAVRRLCRELSYFGMFEVEFLKFDGGWAAIDFNARLFNQIGMDIRRGMPLPLFACLDAVGDVSALREAVAKSKAQRYCPATFCDAFTLHAILFARKLTGRISAEDLLYWREWLRRHADHTVDYAADASDPLPGIIHALSDMYLGFKSLKRFMHSTPRLIRPMSLSQSKVNS